MIGAAGNEVAFGSFCWECGMAWESYAKLTEEVLITKFHFDAAFCLDFNNSKEVLRSPAKKATMMKACVDSSALLGCRGLRR